MHLGEGVRSLAAIALSLSFSLSGRLHDVSRQYTDQKAALLI